MTILPRRLFPQPGNFLLIVHCKTRDRQDQRSVWAFRIARRSFPPEICEQLAGIRRGWQAFKRPAPAGD